MQIPLKMSFEGGLTASEALCARIAREAEKLERFSDRLAACRVSVVGRGGRHRHGELYGVKLTLALPGRDDVVITRNPPADHAHEDVYVAIRDAFDAARRRLQDHRRRFTGRRKSHTAAPSGVVRRLGRLDVGAQVCFSEEGGEEGRQTSTVHA
jgi:ribosome-associated translation inhibitor RaiA